MLQKMSLASVCLSVCLTDWLMYNYAGAIFIKHLREKPKFREKFVTQLLIQQNQRT